MTPARTDPHSPSTPATSTTTVFLAQSAAPTSTPAASTRASWAAPAGWTQSLSTLATSTGRPGFANTIGRANLDGTGVDQSFITTSGVNPPNDVAVDPTHIYWTIHSIYDSFPYPGTIGRANLDGSGVDQSFISGVNYPVGVAVDANHIYWANDVEGTIGRANLDGSGVDQSFISGAGAARDVAVDAGHVYWTDFDAQTIGRANLDGSGIDRSFISGAGAVDDLTVDALTVPETTITSGPRGTTNDASPSFGFRSSQPGASFRCRLESVAWKACASPKSYSRLAGGSTASRSARSTWPEPTRPGFAELHRRHRGLGQGERREDPEAARQEDRRQGRRSRPRSS